MYASGTNRPFSILHFLLRFSLNPPLSQLSLDVTMSVCYLSFCLLIPSWKPRFPVDWRLLVDERIANIARLFQPTATVAIFWWASSALIEYTKDEIPQQELEIEVYLSFLLGSPADFLGSGPGCVEAEEAGGVHHFFSDTNFLVLPIYFWWDTVEN